MFPFSAGRKWWDVSDLIVAVGAIAVMLGLLSLGLGGGVRRRARNFLLTFGWLMVIFGLGAESAALVQSARSTPASEASAP